MRKDWEAAVIGGGPAGTAAAIELARAGGDVCLLERKRIPHHKVCGEFISWEAAHYLNRLGVHLPALGAQAVHRVRLVHGERSLETSLPFQAWSLSRRRLDEILLEKAEHAGARVHRGVAVRDLSRGKDGWTVNTGERSIGARQVFLASGKHDLRHWRRQNSRGRQNRADLIGLKMHLRLTPHQRDALRHTVELHLFDRGYAGLEPVEDGKANLCFLIPRDLFRQKGGTWAGLENWLSETSSHMDARLAGATSLWPRPLAVYGTPYGYVYRSDPEVVGLYRLGDQMAVIPSFAGDGIAMALHTGFLAAGHYRCELGADSYHRQARKDCWGPVRNARILESLLARPPGRQSAMLLGALWPGAITGMIRRTRLAAPAH